MNKFFSAAALIATLAVPAAAMAGEVASKRTFTRDGETYVYTAADKGDKTVLVGRSYPSGRAFTLSVRGNRVSGFSGGVPVSFTTRPVTLASTELAAR